MMKEVKRCEWAKSQLEQEYHDREWGRPEHDDARLFLMLNLEGMQAGLSWSTILKKREAICAAFDNFDPARLIHYDERKKEELLQNDQIIRNRLKINAAVTNAHAYYKLCEQYGSLDRFLWSYVDNRPIVNHFKTMKDVPANTDISDQISKDMKKLGFKFVGTTIIYAFMQSIGMVNDHQTDCFCYKECTDTKVTDTKCADTKCADTKCADTKCTDTKSTDTKSTDTGSMEKTDAD